MHFCVSLQLLSHQEHIAESQEKQVNLKKDLGEMQEWMAQVDEEFLMRDFEYKSPEDLEASLEEMKVGFEASHFEEMSLWVCVLLLSAHRRGLKRMCYRKK